MEKDDENVYKDDNMDIKQGKEEDEEI